MPFKRRSPETSSKVGDQEPQEVEQAAFEAALRLLARREYSKFELRRKLAPRYGSKCLEAVLERLKSLDLQSEERCVSMWVNHILSNAQGPLKLRQELLKRGLDPALAQDLVSAEDYAHSAARALSKLKSTSNPADPRLRERLLAALYRRGFTRSQCLEALNAQGITEYTGSDPDFAEYADADPDDDFGAPRQEEQEDF